MPRKFVHESDEKVFLDYLKDDGVIYDSIMQFSTDEGRIKTVNGAVFRDFHRYLFDNDLWTYNTQNDTLFMLLYDCGGRNKYVDAALDNIFRTLSDNPPKGRVAQNEFLGYVLENLSQYAPYDAAVKQLCDYAEFAIRTNTLEIKKEIPNYDFPIIPEEQKQARDIYRNDIFIEFNSIKDELGKNGWDFSNPEDTEFLRTLMELRENAPEIGRPVFDAFMEKAKNTRIYNVVDKDNIYAFVSDYMKETHVDEYEATLNLRSFIGYVRGLNEPEIKTVAVMTEQTTNLFHIINEIGNTADKRGEIHNLMSYEEGDEAFYNSGFVNEADFARGDEVFDGIFGKLIEEQKKTSLKASEMSEIDLLSNTFKIYKDGKKQPMDLKSAVEKKLKDSGRFLDDKEEGILPNELEARKATNERNMAKLAKLYVLHEMQNAATGIIFEAYFGDTQYTAKDPVAQYLDINHPRIVKAKDLEEHKLQHDQNILDYFGKDQGMLYEENYNAYVMGALADGQVIKLRNPYQKINGMSYADAREAMVQNGWDFVNNPANENYLIMLFNSHDPMGKNHIMVENCLEKLIGTPIHGYHERNDVLREIYNIDEVRAETEDLTMVAFRDYIMEDLKLSAGREITDQVMASSQTFLQDPNKRINGLTMMDMTNEMISRGWEIDIRIDSLIKKLYNAYDENYASAGAIAQCLGLLASAQAGLDLEQMNMLYTDLRNVLSPLKHNDEFVAAIDEYLFDLTTELMHMRGMDVTSILNPMDEEARYKLKNQSQKKVTTDENNAIENVNGRADNMYDGIKEEDFVYSNEPIGWPEDNVKANYENNGNERMYDDQDIDSLIFESRDFAEAYNEFMYVKHRILEDLYDASGRLQMVAKQEAKELGAEGTGTDIYRAMATKLKDCISVLENRDSKPAQIKAALDELDAASANYKKERKSIFGKRGDAKIRYDVSSKLSDGRLSAMKLNLDKSIVKVAEAGRKVRSDLKPENMTDKAVAFACGKVLGKTEERLIPKQSLSVLRGIYDDMNALSRAQAEVNKQLDAIKIKDPATGVITASYRETVNKPGANITDIRKISEKITGKTYQKEIAELKKSKVFEKIVKDNPQKYEKVWKNVCKAADEFSNTSKEFIEGMKESNTFMSYILMGGDKPVSREKDATVYDESYKRLAQIISSQIISENKEFARGIIVDSLDKKTGTRKVMDEFRAGIEAYLKESKILEGRSLNIGKLERELKNGSFTKKAISSITKVKKNRMEKKADKINKVTTGSQSIHPGR